MEIPGINVTQIAVVCHEANRAYCQTVGDTSQPAWGDAPEWQTKSAIDGVVFHLDSLTRGRRPTPADSHNSWLEGKRQDGWTFGPTKDATAKTHPCFVSFEQLPLEQQRKDFIFASIVCAFYDAATQAATVAA